MPAEDLIRHKRRVAHGPQIDVCVLRERGKLEHGRLALVVSEDELGLAVHECDRGETGRLIFAEKALVEFKLEVGLRLADFVRVVALDQRAKPVVKLVALLKLLLVVGRLTVSCCCRCWLIHDIWATSTIARRWHSWRIICGRVLESTRFPLQNVLAIGTEFTIPLVITTSTPSITSCSGSRMTWSHGSRRIRCKRMMIAIGRLMEIPRHVIMSRCTSHEPCSRIASTC